MSLYEKKNYTTTDAVATAAAASHPIATRPLPFTTTATLKKPIEKKTQPTNTTYYTPYHASLTNPKRSYMNYGKNASTISALRTDTIILYLHFILFCWTTEIKQKVLQRKKCDYK